MSDCLFCNIIAGRSPAAILYRDEHVTAIRDINPQAPTHMLVLPNKHIASAADFAEEDAELLGRLLLAASRLASQEGLMPDGYRMVINTGPAAGQSVYHLHLHLLGGRQMAWPPG